MYNTDGYNISIPRGDSANIPAVFVFDGTDEPYIFETGQYALLSVYMDRNKDPVLQKRVEKSEQDETGTAFFHFSPEETDITRYRYLYNIRLYNSDGSEVDTWHGFPERATFEIN